MTCVFDPPASCADPRPPPAAPAEGVRFLGRDWVLERVFGPLADHPARRELVFQPTVAVYRRR